MRNYLVALKQLPGKHFFVGYPAAFDFLFVYWYLIQSPARVRFRIRRLDIKTFALALLKRGFRDSTRKPCPRAALTSRCTTHRALDDAIDQRARFCNMLAENTRSDE
jgi:hypothetical protein